MGTRSVSPAEQHGRMVSWLPSAAPPLDVPKTDTVDFEHGISAIHGAHWLQPYVLIQASLAHIHLLESSLNTSHGGFLDERKLEMRRGA